MMRPAVPALVWLQPLAACLFSSNAEFIMPSLAGSSASKAKAAASAQQVTKKQASAKKAIADKKKAEKAAKKAVVKAGKAGKIVAAKEKIAEMKKDKAALFGLTAPGAGPHPHHNARLGHH
jgi:hypothetical protein